MPTNQILKARIAERLDATKQTKEGAARKAALGRDFIRNINTGKSKSPQAAKLAALAKVLGTTLEYLLGETDDPRLAERNEVMPAPIQLPTMIRADVVKHSLIAMESLLARRDLTRMDAPKKAELLLLVCQAGMRAVEDGNPSASGAEIISIVERFTDRNA